MSPLAEAIYDILASRTALDHPCITYTELAKQLTPLNPTFDDLTRNDPRLFDALGEVGTACRESGRPTLTALVVRAAEKTPGGRYFSLFHPEAGDDPANRTKAWENELVKIRSTKYPLGVRDLSKATQAESRSESAPATDLPGKSQSVGRLRVAENTARAGVVFEGEVTCRRCSQTIRVDVERNASALVPTLPAFLLRVASGTGEPMGHLFIGTRLSSPVLYFGALEHCGDEQRIVIFYNRALRDRSDHHLDIRPYATSGGGDDKEQPFQLA